jgi:hypothetical protein
MPVVGVMDASPAFHILRRNCREPRRIPSLIARATRQPNPAAKSAALNARRRVVRRKILRGCSICHTGSRPPLAELIRDDRGKGNSGLYFMLGGGHQDCALRPWITSSAVCDGAAGHSRITTIGGKNATAAR